MGTAAENTQCFPSKALLHKQMSRPLPTPAGQTAAGAGRAGLGTAVSPCPWWHGRALTLGCVGTARAVERGEGTGELRRQQTSCSVPRENGHKDASCPRGKSPAPPAPPQRRVPETTKTEGTCLQRRGQWRLACPECSQNVQRRCQSKHPAGSWEGVLTIQSLAIWMGPSHTAWLQGTRHLGTAVCQLLERHPAHRNLHAGFPRYTWRHCPSACFLQIHGALLPALLLAGEAAHQPQGS